MNFLKWYRARRESRELAIVAKAAELVIQQRGEQWTNRKCPNCQQGVSDIANFCSMCGQSFVPELQSPPAYRPYEIERHTSGMHPIVIPKRPMPPAGRITSLIRTQDLPTLKRSQL